MITDNDMRYISAGQLVQSYDCDGEQIWSLSGNGSVVLDDGDADTTRDYNLTDESGVRGVTEGTRIVIAGGEGFYSDDCEGSCDILRMGIVGTRVFRII